MFRPVTNEIRRFFEEFEVSEKFMGLALGKRYANLKEARKIKDVTSVELIENTVRFQIYGKTAKAVKTARDMIEYREHHTAIPRYLAEEILEDGGKIMEEVVEQSGLVRIESGQDEDELEEDEDYPIVFVGNPPCIENAKTLLEFQLKLADRKLKKKEAHAGKSAFSYDPNLFVERVPIQNNLKGLACGKNCENLKKAEKIPGVVKVDAPSNMPMIIIYAEHEEAAKKARQLLEFDEDIVEIDPNSLGKVIGKNGITVKKIESSTGARVRIPSKINPSNLTSSGKVSIKISGPAESVPAAIELVKRAEFYGHL